MTCRSKKMPIIRPKLAKQQKSFAKIIKLAYLLWVFLTKLGKTMDQLITISGQITTEDVAVLAKQGVKTIVNNRPDGEESGQPTSDEIKAACTEHGIVYAHIPFSGGMLEMRHVQEFADFYNSTNRPLHIFCRSGNRSSIILQAAREQDLLDDE